MHCNAICIPLIIWVGLKRLAMVSSLHFFILSSFLVCFKWILLELENTTYCQQVINLSICILTVANHASSPQLRTVYRTTCTLCCSCVKHRICHRMEPLCLWLIVIDYPCLYTIHFLDASVAGCFKCDLYELGILFQILFVVQYCSARFFIGPYFQN